jgi:predicted metal-dependent phosphoesterase TrpH
MTGDLHIHTNVSDGTFPPCEVVQKVSDGGLGFFAVTDHNTVGALAQIDQAISGFRLQFIPGVELSAQPEEGHELHLLGYGINPTCHELLDVCRRIHCLKREQLREIVHRLSEAGVDVDVRHVFVDDEDAYVGRPVVARLLVRDGVVSSFGQAFGRYLGRDAPAFVRMRPFGPEVCIEAIHKAGGLAVLAHPSIEVVDRWVAPLAQMGVDGVESYRPALSGNEELYIEKAAEHFGLFVTGGSDWHGREGESPLGAFSVGDAQINGFFAALSSRGNA